MVGKINKRVGKRIKLARRQMGLTQKELAKKLGKTPTALCYFENGQRRVTPDTLVQIAEATDKPIGFFYEETTASGRDEYKTQVAFLYNHLEGVKKLLQEATDERDRIEQIKNIFFHVFSKSMDGVCIGSLDGTLYYVNDAVCGLLGYEQDEMVGKNIGTFSGNGGTEIPKVIDALKRDGKWRGEIVRRRKDGSNLPVDLSATMITDNEGNAVGIMAVMRDITEQKALHRQLREREQYYRNLLDNAPLGIFTVDPEGNLVEYNNYFSDVISKKTMKEFEEGCAFEHPLLIEKGIDEALKDCLKKGEAVRKKFEVESDDEGVKHYSLHLGALKNEEGEVIGIQGILERLNH